MTFTQLLAMAGAAGGRVRVCADSRLVSAGDIFVAIAGVHSDGHAFIRQAVERGAAYVVCGKPAECSPAQMIVVEDSAHALGLLAQASQNNPNAQLTNLAVTGTNGKTTTAFLVQAVIRYAGQKCGLIGTITLDTGGRQQTAAMTTPDALTIAAAAREMVDNGAAYMMIEASSHALSQQRLAGIHFTAAAFTNLTGDHLDYHKTMEDYLAAKTRLFTELPSHAIAILNADSDASRAIAEKTHVRTLWYAVDKPADIAAYTESMDANGSVFSIEFNSCREKVRTPLPGKHNISNYLAAAGLCLAAGFDLTTVARGLSSLRCVPGRLEPVFSQAADKADIRVFVDYAHTDDALQNVLTTLKPICKGNLITVFGCGGDRDKTKRPRMAAVAERLSDRIIVTSDNPRTEDAALIIDDILAGFGRAIDGKRIVVEQDRRKAIGFAIANAGRNDIILLAGKGHEDYQIIGTEKHHFSDVEVAKEYLDLL